MLKKRIFSLGVSLALTIVVSGCGSSSSDTSPSNHVSLTLDRSTIDDTPSNPNANDDAARILAYLADLSTNTREGVLAGQQAGHGNQIVDDENIMGFAQNVERLYEATGQWPAVLGLDYGHDDWYTQEELSIGNQVLIDHWNQGGLIMLTWVPMNPWDLSQNKYTGDVDMTALFDPDSEVYDIWMAQVDNVATALKELQDAGVTVLWRPMQELNGFWFWWGAQGTDSESVYKPVFRELYRYFTEDKQLSNLLWVYAPIGRWHVDRPVMSDYPGDDVVDIVGPTTYNNELDIPDYLDYLTFNKPLAMTELAGYHTAVEGAQGEFDNMQYVTRLPSDYPAVSFWMSWHSWYNGDGTYTHMSIVANEHANEMMNHPDIITLEELNWRDTP
ncbi:glycosyl hydrolase [Aliagarivorans marinus]|uniref:glycosyl hydrolase n=1 Tax=Aliagarivorans marinus TaxID=561965 RepID=UPI000478754F|nr:glycosyl hydrolase [Aliagarivorans marinus]